MSKENKTSVVFSDFSDAQLEDMSDLMKKSGVNTEKLTWSELEGIAKAMEEYHQAKLKLLRIANGKSFAVGKDVEIISNKHSNEFEIGEIVRLVNQGEDGSWEATNGKETWWIEECEAKVC